MDNYRVVFFYLYVLYLLKDGPNKVSRILTQLERSAVRQRLHYCRVDCRCLHRLLCIVFHYRLDKACAFVGSLRVHLIGHRRFTAHRQRRRMINHEFLEQAFVLPVQDSLLLGRGGLLSLLSDGLRSGWCDCVHHTGHVELLGAEVGAELLQLLMRLRLLSVQRVVLTSSRQLQRRS